MKKKKMLVLLGTGLFVLGIGLNIQYAVDDYGVVKSSLHTEVLAQSNSGAPPQKEWGAQGKTTAKCTKATVTVEHIGGCMYGSGGVSAGMFPYKAYLSGGASACVCGSTVTISTSTYDAEKYYCKPPYEKKDCNNYNPCD